MPHTPAPWFAKAAGFGTAIGNAEQPNVAVAHFAATAEGQDNARLISAAPDLLEVARIEQTLHMSGYTKATAKRLGPEAEEAYLLGGAPGLNDWRRRKREAAIAKAEGKAA